MEQMVEMLQLLHGQTELKVDLEVADNQVVLLQALVVGL